MFRMLFSLPLVLAILLNFEMSAQPVEVVQVQSHAVDSITVLTGEILPFQHVSLHARANGYIQSVLVDRGSVVQQGQLLISLTAPELAAQTAEAASRAETAEATRAESEARLAASQATYERLKKAAETPGAIAGNELVQAEKTMDASRAAVRAAESATRAAKASLEATRQSEEYLKITAPFAGVITERNVHPGALVGPANSPDGALLELEQISRLRVVVNLPEAEVASIRRGAPVRFRVPAYPNKSFVGTVARFGRSLDSKTRTMAVELDVANPRSELSPGMYPQIDWPSRSGSDTLLVPSTAVVTTTERTFVIRVRSDGHAEWVNVRRGPVAGEMVEVLGKLAPGDIIVKRGSDEIREGTRLEVRKSTTKHLDKTTTLLPHAAAGQQHSTRLAPSP